MEEFFDGTCFYNPISFNWCNVKRESDELDELLRPKDIIILYKGNIKVAEAALKEVTTYRAKDRLHFISKGNIDSIRGMLFDSITVVGRMKIDPEVYARCKRRLR